MTILKTTLTCLFGLALAACVSESKSSESTPVPAKKAAKEAPKPDVPAAKKAADPAVAGALTTTALKLSKVP
jgi:hypothetical protein